LTRFIVVTDIYGLPSNMGWLSENHALDCLALNALSDRLNFTGHDLHGHLFERDGMQAATSRLAETATPGSALKPIAEPHGRFFRSALL
jgi:hypothetical protein